MPENPTCGRVSASTPVVSPFAGSVRCTLRPCRDPPFSLSPGPAPLPSRPTTVLRTSSDTPLDKSSTGYGFGVHLLLLTTSRGGVTRRKEYVQVHPIKPRLEVRSKISLTSFCGLPRRVHYDCYVPPLSYSSRVSTDSPSPLSVPFWFHFTSIPLVLF